MIEVLGAGWVRFVFDQAVDLPVHLVGDFNGWDENSHRLAPRDDGKYHVLVRLDPGEYEFKYKCGSIWFNDSGAHKYVRNCWGSENSVVVVASATEDESRPKARPSDRAQSAAS